MLASSSRRQVLKALAVSSIGFPSVLHAQTSTIRPVLITPNNLPIGAITFNDDFQPVSGSLYDGTGLDGTLWNNAIWYERSTSPPNYKVEVQATDGAPSGVLKVWPQPAKKAFINRTFDTDTSNTFNRLPRTSSFRGHSQTFGYFEMRAKLCRGVGPWPGFWLFNHTGNDIRPEIDIMEAYPGSQNSAWTNTASRESVRYGTSVWSQNISNLGDNMNPAAGANPNLSRSFNVYGCWWGSDRIRFFFNGVETYSCPTGDVTLPMYIILSLWFGSESGRPSTNSSITPTGIGNSYEIDYIRAWAAA